MKKQDGFSAIEIVLVLVIAVGILATGFWVYSRRASKTADSSTPSANVSTAKPGTTESIDNIAKQESNDEKSIDTKHMSSNQTDASSANSSASGIGGAYNEASL